MKISLFINPSFFFFFFKRPQLSYDETEQGKKTRIGGRVRASQAVKGEKKERCGERGVKTGELVGFQRIKK